MKKFKIPSIAVFAALTTGTLNLTACTSHSGWYPFLYHPTFSQGNLINPNAVKELRLGMSQGQVSTIMGKPLLETPLSPNVWHYVYYVSNKNKPSEEKQLILYFKNDRLIQIQK